LEHRNRNALHQVGPLAHCNGTKAVRASSHVAGITAWRLKDRKEHLDILLDCGENQLIALRSMATSKLVWV